MPLRRLHRLAGPWAMVLLLSAGGLGAEERPPHAFYLDLLQRGTDALEIEDHAQAAAVLRIACFGLLEQPTLLARCLVALGLAQHGIDDQEGFVETFARIAQIEEGFGAWSSAEVDPVRRQRLEEAIALRVSEARLQQIPAFAHLAQRRLELRLAGLSPRQARRRLERALEANPSDHGARLALGRLELEQGRLRRAREHLDRLLAAQPGFEEARCLRGEVQARLGECVGVIGDLPLCGRATSRLDLAEPLLACQVRLERWAEAAATVAGLAPELRGAGRILELAQQLPQGPPAAPETAVAEPPDPAMAETIEALRRELAEAATLEEIEEILERAVAFAEENPSLLDAQLAAAEAAYRASRWQLAAEYFRRAGPAAESRPTTLFYRAVAQYESGDLEGAATTLRRALPRLTRTEYVDLYVQRILPEGAAADPPSGGLD